MRACLRLTFLAAALAASQARADSIADIVSQVTLPEYQGYLRVLSGVDPLPLDPPLYLSTRHSFAAATRLGAYWMRDMLGGYGLDASLHSFQPAFAPNVIGELRGISRPEDVYVLCAHYDSVPGSPGCDDNGSGTAAVLLAAKIFSQYQFEGTIRFIAFSGEEQWMVGSNAYAAAAAAAGENIVAAINLDMILHPALDSHDPDPDYDLDIETNLESMWLTEHVAAELALWTPLDVQVHVDPGAASDQWGFWQHGYTATGLAENTTNELWSGSNDTYHRSSDTMFDPDLDWEFGLHTVRGSLAALADLAGIVPEPASLACLGVLAAGALRRGTRGGRHAALLLITVGLSGPAGTAQTVYVDDDAAAGGDGASWATAYRHLQDALLEAAPGVEVRVAQGQYRPDLSEGGTISPGDQSARFVITSGVSAYGGYRGCPRGDCGGGDPDERDAERYATTLSGDLAGDDTPGVPDSYAENTNLLVEITADSAPALLDGVTARSAGTGVEITSGSLTLRDCAVVGMSSVGVFAWWTAQALIEDCAICSTQLPGYMADAAIAAYGPTTLRRCAVTENACSLAVVWLAGAATVVEDCVIANNRGLGMSLGTGSATVSRCTIASNAPWYDAWGAEGFGGGGLSAQQCTAVLIEDCEIVGNISSAGAGGVQLASGMSDPCEFQLARCTIAWNTGLAGGVRVDGYHPAVAIAIADCVVGGNVAVDLDDLYGPQRDGGGIYLAGGNVALERCAVVGNRAGNGAGLFGWAQSVRVVDSTVAGNWSAGYAEIAAETALEIDRCTFSSNEEYLYFLTFAGEPVLRACMFAGNTRTVAKIPSGGQFEQLLFVGNATSVWPMLWADGLPGARLVNCTVANNIVPSYRAVVQLVGPAPVQNCIFWNNLPSSLQADGNVPVSYCDVQGGWPGAGNLDADPLLAPPATGVWTAAGDYDWHHWQTTFTDAAAAWTPGELVGRFIQPDTARPLQYPIIANTATDITTWADWETNAAGYNRVAAGVAYAIHDYRLPDGSPCINAGSNYVPLAGVDLAAAPRVQQCRVDMGVYESPGPPALFTDCNGNGVLDDCDIWGGTSVDANQDHVPDECQPNPARPHVATRRTRPAAPR